MTQRENQGHLEETYGVEISSALISTLTDAVLIRCAPGRYARSRARPGGRRSNELIVYNRNREGSEE
jgi:hypothetical protein